MPVSHRTNADTHGVLLTPPGRAAIASILVAGPGARAAVAAYFRAANGRELDEQPRDRPVFGHWCADAGERQPGEEVVLWVRRPDEIEVHCHGGRAVVEWIIDSVQSAGGRIRRWEDWLDDEEPPIRAAARIALSQTVTLRAAGVLLDQYNGCLEGELSAIDQLICRSRESSADARRELIASASNRLEQLLARAPVGLHLIRPWNVVLGGRPNVGKSSLINALVGYERAIVHPAAGTTRDVVTAAAALAGWPVLLADTAGLRRADELEASGIEQATRAFREADLRVLMLDRSRPLTPEDHELISRWPNAILVANKSDLPDRTAGELPAQAAHVSAQTGEGIDHLAAALGTALVPEPPEPGTPVPFRADQVDAIKSARQLLAGGDGPGAQVALRSLYLREG